MLDDDNLDFEQDAHLYELRRKFLEMKKERQKFQKDSQLLENKLKLLQNEETKVFYLHSSIDLEKNGKNEEKPR